MSNAPTALSARAKPRLLGRASAAEHTLRQLLHGVQHGAFVLQDPDGSRQTFGHGDVVATLVVHDRAMFKQCLSGGDIGLAEAFIQGRWACDDLPALLALLMKNRDALDRAVYGSWVGSLLYRLRHVFRRNSKRGSRRNIVAHYDLGNAFYARWLDATMNYSSAWFQGDLGRPMAEAQHAKIDRALDETRVRPGTRLLEIGCGWGSLAERAAQRGAHVVGVTLSDEQLRWGQARLQDAGLGNLATLQLKDYRDLGAHIGFEPYDAVVSIEMVEAVGQAYWSTYFDTVARCLKRDGRACIQSITLRDDLFARYVKSTDFIQQYVFPGGMLPSDSAFRQAARQAGLVVEQALDFGADYAETLRRWRASFLAEAPTIRGQGFGDDFMRLWDFYLAYCQAAFETGNTSVTQFTLRHAP